MKTKYEILKENAVNEKKELIDKNNNLTFNINYTNKIKRKLILEYKEQLENIKNINIKINKSKNKIKKQIELIDKDIVNRNNYDKNLAKNNIEIKKEIENKNKIINNLNNSRIELKKKEENTKKKKNIVQKNINEKYNYIYDKFKNFDNILYNIKMIEQKIEEKILILDKLKITYLDDLDIYLKEKKEEFEINLKNIKFKLKNNKLINIFDFLKNLGKNIFYINNIFNIDSLLGLEYKLFSSKDELHNSIESNKDKIKILFRDIDRDVIEEMSKKNFFQIVRKRFRK